MTAYGRHTPGLKININNRILEILVTALLESINLFIAFLMHVITK